jgi:hypothetical protein
MRFRPCPVIPTGWTDAEHRQASGWLLHFQEHFHGAGLCHIGEIAGAELPSRAARLHRTSMERGGTAASNHGVRNQAYRHGPKEEWPRTIKVGSLLESRQRN